MPVRNVKINDVSMDYFLRGTEAARPQGAQQPQGQQDPEVQQQANPAGKMVTN